jgi:hypothetical protein
MSRFERSILGALLLNHTVYGQGLELQIEDFSLDSHRRIFACMVDLAAVGSPIDLLTVVEELGRRRELWAVGGGAYLSDLVEGLPERPSIEHYVKIVRACSQRRSAAKLIEKAQVLFSDPSVPMAALSEIGNDLTELVAGAESLPPRFSEEALALRFSRRYAQDLRYVSRGEAGCVGMGRDGWRMTLCTLPTLLAKSLAPPALMAAISIDQSREG